MTSDEVSRLLTVIAARYPTSKLWDQDAMLTAQAWHMSLADVPYAEAEAALVEWFKTEKWAPDPSELRTKVAERMLDLPSAEEAWIIARSAINRYYPGHVSQLDIPDTVRRAINAIGGVHNLKMSETPAKDREAFSRAYAVYRKREIESAVLDREMLGDSPLLELMGRA